MFKSRYLPKVAIILFLGVISIFAWKFSQKWLQQVCFIPIEVVSIKDKLQYVDPLAVKNVVMEHVQEGFFGMRVARVQQELKALPWVASAQVQRRWPGALEINLAERQPLATWQGKGVIDTEGKLFFPPNVAAVQGLPNFLGSQEMIDTMVDTYLLILSSLKPIGLAVSSLEIMPDRGWRAIIDNGMTIILGQNELAERLSRFVTAYDKIVGEKPSIVDLRYTNGLAIG